MRASGPTEPALSAEPPAAPWRLRGEALWLFADLGLPEARRLVPAGLQIVPPRPGRALGGLYLARYGAGSTLQYHELIVIPALVRRGRRLGAWISHIYVDDPRSLAGGRRIWGLPKQLAEFSGDFGQGELRVVQDGQLLCRVGPGASGRGLPVPLLVPAFGGHAGDLRWFQARGRARLSPIRAQVEVPPTSPLADPGWRWHNGLRAHNLALTVGAPRAVR